MTWQPGQSGNPSGLPGRKPFLDAITMELAMWQQGKCDPVPKNSPRSLIRSQILKAEKGDWHSLAWICERTEGKARTVIGGDDEHPIALTLSRAEEARNRLEAYFGKVGDRGG